MPIDNFPGLDASGHQWPDDTISTGQARESRSGSNGSHDSLLAAAAGVAIGGGGGDLSSPASLFGSSLGSSRSSYGSGRFLHPASEQTKIKSSSLPHPESDFPENTNGFQPLYQDQMTKLRSISNSSNQSAPITEHTPQVVAPSAQTNGGLGGGNSNGQVNGGGGGGGLLTTSSSSSFDQSSDESSGYAGRSRSPSLLSNLCHDFKTASASGASAAAAPPPAAKYNGGGGGHSGPLDHDRLLSLSEKTGYPIIQRNGQRIYGPPPNWGDRELPSKGCEVFVGRVPRDVYEPDLVPIFERVGMIYELRLMMDFSGSNRGFFFVRYTCKEDAKQACKQLDNYEIRPHKRLGVLMSLDNNKLWLSGIPNGATQEDIKTEIEALTEGVCRVILYPSPNDRSRPRKYAFVEYENHRAAALARRRLVPTKIIIKGHEIEKVDWAEPQNEVDEEIMSTVKVLFVRNLTEATSEEQLVHMFNKWGKGQVERVKKAKDYAFIHFYNRAAAEMAKMYSDNQVIDGEMIEVEWSKPVDKTIYNTRKALTKLFSQPAPPMPPSMQRMCPHDPLSQYGVSAYMNGNGMMRGAPGTLPPRNLIRKLAGATGQMLPPPQPMIPPAYHHHHHQPSPKSSSYWTGGYCGAAGDGAIDPAITKALSELKLGGGGGGSVSPGILGSFPGGQSNANGGSGSPPTATTSTNGSMDGFYVNPHQGHHPFSGVFGHASAAQLNYLGGGGAGGGPTHHHHPAAGAAAGVNPFALNQWLAMNAAAAAAATHPEVFPMAPPPPPHHHPRQGSVSAAAGTAFPFPPVPEDMVAAAAAAAE